MKHISVNKLWKVMCSSQHDYKQSVNTRVTLEQTNIQWFWGQKKHTHTLPRVASKHINICWPSWDGRALVWQQYKMAPVWDLCLPHWPCLLYFCQLFLKLNSLWKINCEISLFCLEPFDTLVSLLWNVLYHWTTIWPAFN